MVLERSLGALHQLYCYYCNMWVITKLPMDREINQFKVRAQGSEYWCLCTVTAMENLKGKTAWIELFNGIVWQTF